MDILDAVGIHLGNIGLEFEDEQSDRAMISQMQSQLAEPPTLSQAIRYKQENSLCSQGLAPFPICKTKSKEIGSYSIGLELYFLFLKQMTILFFLISCISAFPLYHNYQGGFFDVQDPLDANAAVSIGNLNLSEDSNDDAYFISWFSNFCYTVLMLVLIPCFVMKATFRIRKNIRRHNQITDFALEINGFPEEGIVEEDLHRHFQCNGGIHEIYIARRYRNRLFDYRKRANYKIKAIKRCTIVKAKGKNPEEDRTFANACRAMEKFDKKLAAQEKREVKSNDELPMIRAYIVFNEQADKAHILKKYTRYYCCSYPSELLLNGEYRLKVQQAPDPSNILFENLEVSKSSRCIRRFFSLFVLLAMMGVSVALVYEVKTIDDLLPICEGTYSGSLAEAQEEYVLDDDVFCWCKTQSFSDIISDSDLFDFCSDYLSQTSESTALRLLSVCGIFITNLFLKVLIRCLIRFERIENYSKQQRKVMIRVFWAMFINTGLIILMVNANLQEYSIFEGVLFDGKYEDFNPEWYLKVGGLYMIMAVLAVFSPHILILLIKYPTKTLKRVCCWKRYKTQYELNMAILGGIFDIATRKAQILMIIFVMFMFSGGMPILNVICFIALFIIYWTEKVLILRYYRKPPFFSERFYTSAMKLLYLAVIIHCLFSVYMYGSPDIFPQENEHEILYRFLETEAGIWLSLTAAGAVIMYALSWLILKTCKKCLKRLYTNAYEKKSQRLEEVIQDIQARSGIASYNILANPKYSHFIDAINRVAENVREMRENSPRHPKNQSSMDQSKKNKNNTEIDRDEIHPPPEDQQLSDSSSDFDFEKAESIPPASDSDF